MPYCPKCDMEFVEGITVCSDCGGPLMDMEEALRIKEEEKLQKAREYDAFDAETDAPPYASDPGENTPETAEAREQVKTYISKRQRYEDMRSSISAFFMLGGVFLIFGILCLADIIILPLDKGPAVVFELVLTAMGAGCLLVAAATKKSAGRMIKEAAIEDARTKELVTWFIENFNAKEMDAFLLKEDPALIDNELYLKRFELIQDRLITAHDLPDAGYVDYLSEDIYGKIFEK